MTHIFRIDPDSNVTQEMETFIDFDLDKSGKLEKNEIEKWLLPSDFNPAEAEFTHLLDTADADKDGNLNLTEILEKYFILLEFQTTKWGQITHDEL